MFNEYELAQAENLYGFETAEYFDYLYDLIPEDQLEWELQEINEQYDRFCDEFWFGTGGWYESPSI